MKNIVLIICCLLLGNTIKAQDLTAVMHTDFDYAIISPSEHHFIFYTSFTFGYGGTCPPFTNSAFSIIDDTLYVKGYYDIRGAWPAAGCQRTDVVVYNNTIPANITHIITSTNVIKYSSAAPGYMTVENVYTRDFDLGALAVNDFNRKKISVYPNPTNGLIQIGDYKDVISCVNIYDNLGRNIQQFKNLKDNNLDLKDLDDGVYFMEIETAKGNYKEKIILKK